MVSAEVTDFPIEQPTSESGPTKQPFRFLDLLPELRLMVYDAYIDDCYWQLKNWRNHLTCTPLRSVCKLIKHEFHPLHLRAQWQVRRVEADIELLNLTRLIEFVKDDDRD
ncbi:hypothetical protein B0A48_04242 [Cryoendolithus antarcticus]|uniref:Uncharacterized protein n=1 Tax=Cryoendolithus antarcticus TaxID=1507870 RepID=A0A1V8TF45_9PEZI|nr:hypothetical protein B0A48_04242 [Cryoendolithus antarcticus]